MTAATTGSGSATIAYDPLGRLQQVGAASTTRYLYDGAMLVAEYNTSGTMLRRYVPGQGVDETLPLARARGVHRSKPSAGRFCRPAANRSSRYEGADLSSPHWLHTDQQGSVIATTDASATATPYAYSATGEPKGGWSSSAPAFRYTGQIAIASAALYFYKARIYDPALGRFLQTDPTGYGAGMNLYTYVGNNYINSADPTGLAFCNVADDSGCAGNPYGLFSSAIKTDPANPENILNDPGDRTNMSMFGANGRLWLTSAAGAAAPSGVETVIVTGTRILSGLLPWAMDFAPPMTLLGGIFWPTPAGENCADPTALGCAGHVLKNEPPEARAQRCEENLNRDLATCQALGRRRGRDVYRICEQQAMLRYGNCLAGRDGEGGINAPLPPWGW